MTTPPTYRSKSGGLDHTIGQPRNEASDMSQLDSERIRREAADAMGSRPPAASDSRLDEAMRRYLGGSLYELERGVSAERRPDAPLVEADKDQRQ